jgi:hypothetical protein
LADLLGFFPNMLDHGLTPEIKQNLARQTRGSDASRDAKGNGHDEIGVRGFVG